MMKVLKRPISFVVLVGFFASPAHADDELTPLASAIASNAGRALDWPPTPRQTAVQAFYEERGYSPLWVDETGFKSEAQSVIEEMAKADTWGLSAGSYTVAPPRDISDASLAEAEIRLSFTILDYVEAARGGRITQPSEQLSSYLDRRPNLPDPLTVLREFGTSHEPVATLLSYHPQHEQFARLRAAYLTIVSDAQRIRDTAIAIRGPNLRKGMDDPEVAVLKKRLGLASTTTLFDDELDAAVRRFQREHGARGVDGIVGYRTRRALNTTDTSKLATLRANMEQWRWMPADLGASHVLVNIPEFKVELIRDGAVAFSERVVVGKTATQTPIFSHRMQTVVLHPRWYVPESIKVKEFLPSLLRGRSLESRGFVLSRNGKEISSRRVNWSKADIRNYDVYQSSGDYNALGQVKFLFPNQHAVYLHDTPKRHLFNSSVRTFSHGCIRVRNPLKFAKLLLNDDKGWSEQHVKDLAADGPLDNAITLDDTVPVHIAYFTAWVDDDGTLRTVRDIYGHERRIKLALEGRWSEIDKGKNHLAPVDMAEVKRSQPKRSSSRRKTATASSGWSAPMGLLGGSSAQRPRRSSGSSANDVIRRAFGF
ncbi:L,D-transpeptidase family protein [Hyphomicrobium sp. CS1GBMeth3]|uniref:L,D-transpeptidase family protein n=1 Tax=Hyphomicrobium sp. CS1GBMeth3 TaxID=1892845 RepID=UPI0009FAD8F2|nr:L,D-transpeptidase family protein [Hyphomicrobium sp. CS1GBMeth3]